MKRRIVAFLVCCCCVLGMSATVFAAENDKDNFKLTIPYPFVNSMQSTALYEKEAGESPFVSPKINTILTNYFLSPNRRSSITATDIVAIDTPRRRSFSYQSGYGGVGQEYCLSAYPGVSGEYISYTTKGTWSR